MDVNSYIPPHSSKERNQMIDPNTNTYSRVAQLLYSLPDNPPYRPEKYWSIRIAGGRTWWVQKIVSVMYDKNEVIVKEIYFTLFHKEEKGVILTNFTNQQEALAAGFKISEQPTLWENLARQPVKPDSILTWCLCQPKNPLPKQYLLPGMDQLEAA
jgi:hypothetical protein